MKKITKNKNQSQLFFISFTLLPGNSIDVRIFLIPFTARYTYPNPLNGTSLLGCSS
jgi:hypothetical protein